MKINDQYKKLSNPRVQRGLGFFLLASLTLIACNLSSLTPILEGTPTHEIMTPTSAIPQEPFALPAPLYYLQAGQIWRLEVDVETRQQITQENAPIDAFDIAPTTGMLAYISNNSLIIAELDGSGRQIVQAGSALPVIPDKLERLNAIEHITSAIRTPIWSPNGQFLAFIKNGVQVFDVETNQVELIWSQTVETSEPYLFDSLYSWSPNGQYLLASHYSYPIKDIFHNRLVVIHIGESLFPLGLSADWMPAWSADSSALFLAYEKDGMDSLMRIDQPDWLCCYLLSEYVPGLQYYHFAYPHSINDDVLYVFMGFVYKDSIKMPDTFRLFSLTSEGKDSQRLRNDGYRLKTALWTQGGEGVVIVTEQATEDFEAGSALWLSTSDTPAIPLPVKDPTNLRWGSKP